MAEALSPNYGFQDGDSFGVLLGYPCPASETRRR